MAGEEEDADADKEVEVVISGDMEVRFFTAFHHLTWHDMGQIDKIPPLRLLNDRRLRYEEQIQRNSLD